MTLRIISLILQIVTFAAIVTLVILTLRHHRRLPPRKDARQRNLNDLHISLADRITVWRTNATGRAVPDIRLARYAILRAEIALGHHTGTQGSATKRFQTLFSLVSATVYLIAGQLLVAYLSFHLKGALIVAIVLFLIATINAVATVSARSLFRRDQKMACAAIAANRDLLNKDR